MNKSEIVFLVRAYNESKKIEEVIKSIIGFGYKNILIIDDGSTDNTEEIIHGIKKSNKDTKIILLRHLFNRGGGASLETGFEYIRKYGDLLGFNYIFTFDADGQHNINDSKNFISQMEKSKNLDIILGSRFIEKTNTNAPFHRRVILFLGIIFTYITTGLNFTDSHNGYRLLKLSAIKKIKLTMDGMEYASELIEQIKINNLKYKEIPVNIKYTEYSLNKGQKSSNAINIALRMIWNKFFK
ncbi:cell wall biosynthesis glycosyltransferase [Candidatus Gracilibacteria bacterium]|nr:MAG: cell wall biosynthesis glycosyltransferase [Candidatus Gracilibacteria bacterium]PIE84942.1 MAG: cell wall biosynthesis glycosyltransferase [Candidatus Gracilibacteria bacterium]